MNVQIQKRKLENDTSIIFGGIFFLRFLIPAIVYPHKYGILSPEKKLSSTTLKGLVHLGKILNSLATKNISETNNTELKDFFGKYSPIVENFFSHSIEPPLSSFCVKNFVNDSTIQELSKNSLSLIDFFSKHRSFFQTQFSSSQLQSLDSIITSSLLNSNLFHSTYKKEEEEEEEEEQSFSLWEALKLPITRDRGDSQVISLIEALRIDSWGN